MPSLLYIGTPPLGRQAKGVLSYPPPFIRGKRASPLPKEDHLSEMISGEDGTAPARPFSGPFPGFRAPAGLPASPRSGLLLTVRKEEVVQEQGESFRGLVDREVVQGDELPEEGGHRMAVPAPVDGELRDGDGERTGVVLGLVRSVNGLALHQVVEGVVLCVPVLALGVERICQLLRQGVDIVRARMSRLRGFVSFHFGSDLSGWSCRSGRGIYGSRNASLRLVRFEQKYIFAMFSGVLLTFLKISSSSMK